ncbi:MAG: hypothetical protein K0R75_2174 [Paenibacillaceae bacterium]|jgi:hypothetical protein|nr:hypothetical protein [Paenibacillaceae bacterium]
MLPIYIQRYTNLQLFDMLNEILSINFSQTCNLVKRASVNKDAGEEVSGDCA